MALTNDQKTFIKCKVKTLGNIEKVKEFYKRKSLVCEYAYQYATKLYKRKIKRREK